MKKQQIIEVKKMDEFHLNRKKRFESFTKLAHKIIDYI